MPNTTNTDDKASQCSLRNAFFAIGVVAAFHARDRANVILEFYGDRALGVECSRHKNEMQNTLREANKFLCEVL